MAHPLVTNLEGDTSIRNQLVCNTCCKRLRTLCSPLSGLCSAPNLDQCTTTSDRVWTLDDLQILHELHIPVVVVVPSIIEQTADRYSQQPKTCSPCPDMQGTSGSCRPTGRLHGLRTVFQSSEFLRRYGLPLQERVFSEALECLPSDVRKAKIAWFLKIIMVCMDSSLVILLSSTL